MRPLLFGMQYKSWYNAVQHWGECSELLGKQGATQKEKSLTGGQVLDSVIVENTSLRRGLGLYSTVQ